MKVNVRKLCCLIIICPNVNDETKVTIILEAIETEQHNAEHGDLHDKSELEKKKKKKHEFRNHKLSIISIQHGNCTSFRFQCRSQSGVTHC